MKKKNTERNKRIDEKLKIKKCNKIQIKTKELGTSAKDLQYTVLIFHINCSSDS